MTQPETLILFILEPSNFNLNLSYIIYLHFNFSCFSMLQNLCVTAAHRPIREILEKEKKVSLSLSLSNLMNRKKER